MSKKPLKRAGITPFKSLNKPDGSYTGGITNEAFCIQLGILVSYWPHVEDQMIELLGLLLGDEAPARQVFRAISAQNARIKVMRALLERARKNKDKGREYDELIDEFASLNDLRNTYCHSLWTTHESTRVFLTESSLEDTHFFEAREVVIEELQNATIRMGNLWRRVYVLKHPELAGAFLQRPLLDMPPPQPDVESPAPLRASRTSAPKRSRQPRPSRA